MRVTGLIAIAMDRMTVQLVATLVLCVGPVVGVAVGDSRSLPALSTLPTLASTASPKGSQSF